MTRALPSLGAEQHSTWRLCRRLLRYALRRWQAAMAVVATLLLSIGIQVLRPWPLKVLVDNVLGGHPLSGTLRELFAWLPGHGTRDAVLWWCVGATVILFLLAWGIGLAATYAGVRFGQRMSYDVASDLFNHLQRLSLRLHSRLGVGNAIRRVTTDSECVATIVQDAMLPVATSLVSLVAMFVVMLQLDPDLTLLSLIVLPAMALTIKRYSGPMLERSYEQHTAEGEMYDTIEQTLTALPVVQAFGAEERGDERFRADTDRILAATVATTWAQFRFKLLIGAATSLGTTLILYVGSSQALSGSLTIGTMLVFISYLGSLYGPLEDVMHGSGTVQGAAGSARRVVEILDAPTEVHEEPHARTLPRIRGHVKLEGVTFGYEPGRPVLRGVTLEARPGRTLAIVGATGAGKSTLVSLIPRFFDPSEGRVLLDGHDLRTLTLATVRSAVSLVLQESFLFPFSIAENIAYGRPDASRAAVVDAARAANAHQFIERLPDGYDTVVGERGATLSGGERQRVAIARALLKDAPVLILDEPTAALDAETEALLLEALDRLMVGRTTLIIAHRLSTVRAADEIVVLDHGRVVERGNHEALLRHDGAYARLHAAQVGRSFVPRQRRVRFERLLLRGRGGRGRDKG